MQQSKLSISERLERAENRITNFLTSLGYHEGVEYYFSDQSPPDRLTFIIMRLRTLNPNDLSKALTFAMDNDCDLIVGKLEQTGPDSALLPIGLFNRE